MITRTGNTTLRYFLKKALAIPLSPKTTVNQNFPSNIWRGIIRILSRVSKAQVRPALFLIMGRASQLGNLLILPLTKTTVMEEQEQMIAGLIAMLLIPMLIIAIISIVSMWKVFVKAGQPGWACIIPIYNWYIMIKIVGKPDWWLIMMFIPIVNLVYAIWVTNLLSKSFGKDEGFTVGLLLLSFIFWPILAFGSAKYLGPYGDPARFQAMQQPNFDFENKG